MQHHPERSRRPEQARRGKPNVRDLLILGTGVHCAEMAEIVERVNGVAPTWNLLGFIATSDQRTGERLNGYPVLGPSDRLADFPEACFVSDHAWPHPVPRERLVTVIDPQA